MRKLFTFLIFIGLFSLTANAWVGNSFIFVDKDGSDLWYTGSNSYIHNGGKFHGANLGVFADDFKLGGEVQVWPAQTTPATLSYRIDDGPVFDISLPHTGSEGNNSKHQGKGTVSIADLENGIYTISVWLHHSGDLDNNDDANYVATFTVDKVTPLVHLSVPESAFQNDLINLSATVDNVTNPVYTYSVKVPESGDFVSISSPYQPTEVGTYTFKVEVTENGSGPVLATDTKDVEVTVKPDDIVIKVKNEAGWESMYIFTWGNQYGGHNEMTLEDDWYIFTFEGLESVSFLLTEFDESFEPKTDNIEGVSESTCFVLQASLNTLEVDCDNPNRRDIKIKVENTTGDWENVYVFVWGTDDDGHKLMTVEEGWYVYTIENVYSANFLFTNAINQEEDWSDVEQTQNYLAVTESTCYEVGKHEGDLFSDITDCDKDLGNSNNVIELANSNITVNNRTINVELEGQARVALYSLTGQLVHQEVANNQFTYTTSSGVYILRINNDTHKVIVR